METRAAAGRPRLARPGPRPAPATPPPATPTARVGSGGWVTCQARAESRGRGPPAPWPVHPSRSTDPTSQGSTPSTTNPTSRGCGGCGSTRGAGRGLRRASRGPPAAPRPSCRRNRIQPSHDTGHPARVTSRPAGHGLQPAAGHVPHRPPKPHPPHPPGDNPPPQPRAQRGRPRAARKSRAARKTARSAEPRAERRRTQSLSGSTPPLANAAPSAKWGLILLSYIDRAEPIAMCMSRYL